ncbi:tRNA epoxyqueuosine(34) reductase QueG [Aestuariirhabdus sp. Z084]|uniref:tRNA epoxyqueuosine(34) reductase QueG n=1 Tax=Aestuariirhabdus haliotis TaxID=2918751 RepID=UPI00201B3EBC|nr:tRNA epoxyqueuosine(34) reductase QueG [Aestuariirhabdus haliotis]MCL6415631.1 tRNA epoxyqueuosine(34) reductase QueG [Aestuariirhabdus haliotis]MCL6419626.1 tRNA epoxyqueuosine(34) reductase QueG [Aestuariirhabdus haliotis]
MPQDSTLDYQQLAADIHHWGRELGFQQIGIGSVDLAEHEQHLQQWLDKGYHGEMDYLARHGNMRSRPAELLPGTLRVISARIDYLPPDTNAIRILNNPDKAYLSRYALGRDYHKLVRKRLTQLGKQIEQAVGQHGYRAFVDSAPVLERALGSRSGLGWIGKNTMLINRQAGSWFFLGELFTDLPLPLDEADDADHCGRCTKCLEVCPTNAFVNEHELDARRCISYLTIELKGAIPLELREPMGNRVFGCDDCQLVCPWNRFAKASSETDFRPRHQLDSSDLADLFTWTEEQFLDRTAGSPIRRSGYAGWLRNLAVGLGNAPTSPKVVDALLARRDIEDAMVREHIEWALERHPINPA